VSVNDIDFIKEYLGSKGMYLVSDDFDLIEILKDYIMKYGSGYVKDLVKRAAYAAQKESKK